MLKNKKYPNLSDMVNKLNLMLVFIAVSFAINAQNEIIIEGTYQGKNLYIQNPFGSSGVGFCVVDVKVNGQTSIGEINSSAFEINFPSYQIQKGESVIVKIIYKDDCSPRVLNPEDLRASSTFDIVSINVDKEGVLSWVTQNETGSLPYIVEQFRWNKWIKVGEIKGVGTEGEHSYTFKTDPHSGANKFRIKQIDHTKKARESKEVRLMRSSAPELFITNENLNKITSNIIFKDANGNVCSSLYEVTDQFGNLVKKGKGKEIDISKMNKGVYYISYDNKVEKIEKK